MAKTDANALPGNEIREVEDRAESRCKCRICERSRRIEAIQQRRDPDELVKLVDELHEDLSLTEDDLDYRNAIWDGSWPGSKGMIEYQLQKITEKEKVVVGDSGDTVSRERELTTR